MSPLFIASRTSPTLASLLLIAGCSGSDPASTQGNAGGTAGSTTPRGGSTANASVSNLGGTTVTSNTGGVSTSQGGTGIDPNSNTFGGAPTGGAGKTATGGVTNMGSAAGGTAAAGTAAGGSVSRGGSATGGKTTAAGSGSLGGSAAGGSAAGGSVSRGGSATGGKTTAAGSGSLGGSAAGGTSNTAGSSGISNYPCDGTTAGYNVTMLRSGSTWTVTSGSTQRYSGSDTTAALTAAYNGLTSGRSTKQSILVHGDGDIPASSQVAIPSYTLLNWCGTLNVSGTPSGSDRSPLYARNRTDIEIPNLKMTGAPQYGLFFRGTNNIKLGRIDLRLTSSAGIGIRVDTSGSAGTDTTFVTNLAVDYVYGSGMGSHILETYGVDGVKIGTVEGSEVGECGLLLNRSIHAEVGQVTCTNCATGTGYAAFRVANSVGKVGNAFPIGNIHVGKVYARGGGRGIFSVSGCGGLTIDEIDIANTGNTSILLQNTYDTTIAAVSGSVNGGLVQLSNDTDNTNDGTYLPSKNVAIKNLVLSGGASVRQDWCSQYGANGCSATNVTGGSVSMCP